MVHVQYIDSLDLPEVAPYRTMRRQVEHRQQGIFVAESVKVIQRLLDSRFEVVSLLLPEKWLAHFEPLLAKRSEDIRVFVLEKQQLETLTGFTFYQGVLAVGRIPPAPTVDQLLQQSSSPCLFAAVEGLSNAENLGGLVRSCAAFGAQGLLVDRTSASPYLRRAIRSSMGTIFRLPVVENLDLPEVMPQLRGHQVVCVAAHPRAQGGILGETPLPQNCCLVFGSEGHGISDRLLAACDQSLAIPMESGVDSLNVGNAAAVFLYEASRRPLSAPSSELAR